MIEYYLPDIPRLYTALAEDGLSDFYFAFQKKIFTGCNRLSCGRRIWNTERISDFPPVGRLIFWIPCMIF